MRVALYARVSTKDRQEVDNQLIVLRQACAKENWIIVQEYVDHASGGTSARPEFQRMFEDAAKKKFDIVLFWALDRFTREGTLKTLLYLERLEDLGVNFRSHTESWLDSLGPFRDVVLALLATLAKQERKRMGERIKAGLQRARDEGKIFGRKKCGLDPDEVQQLKAQGMSLREIGRELGVSYMTVKRTLMAMEVEADGRTQQN